MKKTKRTISIAIIITIIMALFSTTALASPWKLTINTPRTETYLGTVCQVSATVGRVNAGIDGYCEDGFVFAEAYHPTYKEGNYKFFGATYLSNGTMTAI